MTGHLPLSAYLSPYSTPSQVSVHPPPAPCPTNPCKAGVPPLSPQPTKHKTSRNSWREEQSPGPTPLHHQPLLWTPHCPQNQYLEVQECPGAKAVTAALPFMGCVFNALPRSQCHPFCSKHQSREPSSPARLFCHSWPSARHKVVLNKCILVTTHGPLHCGLDTHLDRCRRKGRVVSLGGNSLIRSRFTQSHTALRGKVGTRTQASGPTHPPHPHFSLSYRERGRERSRSNPHPPALGKLATRTQELHI